METPKSGKPKFFPGYGPGYKHYFLYCNLCDTVFLLSIKFLSDYLADTSFGYLKGNVLGI